MYDCFATKCFIDVPRDSPQIKVFFTVWIFVNLIFYILKFCHYRAWQKLPWCPLGGLLNVLLIRNGRSWSKTE